MLSKLKKIIIVGSLFLLTACNEMTLFTNLEEEEANLMLAVLLKENLAAERIADAHGEAYNLIIKDADYFPEAIEALSMHGYPRKKFENLCTTFKGDGMVSTPLEQKARYTCAKSQELAGALMSIDGIVMAQVNLVMSETDPISRKVKPASASVFIKYKSEMDVSSLIPKVKKMIAFGVESLPYQNVEVFANPTGKQREFVEVARGSDEAREEAKIPNLMTSENVEPVDRSNFWIYFSMGFLFLIMLAAIRIVIMGQNANSASMVLQTQTNDMEF